MNADPWASAVRGQVEVLLRHDENLGLRNRRFLGTSLAGDALDVVLMDQDAARPLVARMRLSSFRDDPAPSSVEDVSSEIIYAILAAPSNDDLVVEDGVIQWQVDRRSGG